MVGDESWSKARYGLQHNMWPDHLLGNEASLSSSPHESGYSSPNTSNTTDDNTDFDMYAAKHYQHIRKRFLVPETAKPLYHTVTKQVLRPGEELPDSDDERDESWVHQKQRDLINDFTDVTLEEKEFINEWNPFIVEQQLTNAKFLPDAIKRYVEAKKDWIAEKVSRREEFMKLMETFILRGELDEQCVRVFVGKIRAAQNAKAVRDQEDVEMKDAEPEKPVSKKRGLLICICGIHTRPPLRVVCTGSVSPFQSFPRSMLMKSTAMSSTVLLQRVRDEVRTTTRRMEVR